MNKVMQETRKRVAAMTSAERVATAVGIISDMAAPFNQAQRHDYLIDCGLSGSEYLQALNQASGGELVRAALGGQE